MVTNVIELMKIKKTCVYHKSMEFSPVLVEIIHYELKKHYMGNYLLQLYDKQGEKRYQLALECKIIEK